MGRPTEPPGAEALIGILLDEMYPPALAGRLRARGHDVIAVLEVEVGSAARSDEDVLAWAARNNRCVVTGNVADFARLAQQGFTRSGIILVSSRRFPRTARGIHSLEEALDAVLADKVGPGVDGIAWL